MTETQRQRELSGHRKTEAPLIGWKKVRVAYGVYAIAKLLIAKGTRIYSSKYGWYPRKGQKHRASVALVLQIKDLQGNTYDHGYSLREQASDFQYVVGQKVRPTKRFSKMQQECAAGIHFFLAWNSAAAYEL